MAMWDDEESEWYIVVYLEWSKSKIPSTPNGNKKDSLLVCGLMPGHQNNEIAAAEDKTDIREARIINEAIYVVIIVAGNAQTRPVMKKTPPATLATPVASKDIKRITRTHGREHRS